MTRTACARRGNALVVVLLLLVVAAAVAAFFVLRSEPESIAPPTTAPKSAPAAKAAKADGETDATAQRTDATGGDPDAAPANGTSFTIVCFDQDAANKPIAGLDVVATPLKRTETDPAHAVTLKTDASGTTKFEKLPFRTYEVSAAPPGRSPLTLGAARDGQRFELIFGKGAPILGKVVGANDQPLAHVWVQVRSDLGSSRANRQIQEAMKLGKDQAEVNELVKSLPHYRVSGETGDDGTFNFASMPVGQSVTVSLDHEEYDTLVENFEVKDDKPVEKRFVLVPRTEIFGRVISGETGEPLSGVKIELGEGGVPATALRMFSADVVIASATTDPNGNYRFPRVQRGPQALSIQHAGYDAVEENFQATGLEPNRHDIKLFKSAGLTGQVVDSANNPIEGVSIYWNYPEVAMLEMGAKGDPAATTIADGTFQIRNLPVNRPITLISRHAEYVDAKQENIVLQPGESLTGLQIMMSKGGSITGTVVDTTRQPVVGASIVARAVRPAGSPLAAVVSGPDGAFIVNNTPPASYDLECTAPEYVAATKSDVRDVTTGVQIVLVKAATYSGKLVADSGGDPVKKYRVRVRPSDGAAIRAATRAESIRDADGKFEIKGLAPGMWDFEFTADEFAPLTVRGVAVREGEKVASEDVRIKRGTSCTGVVKTDAGKPVAAALVRMEYNDSFSSADRTFLKLQSQTNSNGEFEIKSLASGRYTIWVGHPLFAPSGDKDITVNEAGPNQVDFELKRPARLRLVVHDKSGNTVPGATAFLFQGESPLDGGQKTPVGGGSASFKLKGNQGIKEGIAVSTDPDSSGGRQTKVNDKGEVTWARKNAGEWTLWVTAQGFVKYSAKLKLEAGKEAVHEAVLLTAEPGMVQQNPPVRANQAPKPKNPAMEKLTEAQRDLIKKKRRGEPLTADEKKQYKEIRKVLQGGTAEGDGSTQGTGEAGAKKGKHGKKAKTPPAGDGQDGSKPPAGDGSNGNGSGGGN